MSAPVRQSAFTVVARLKADPASRAKLAQCLAIVDAVEPTQRSFPYGSFPELHYWSFVVVERPGRSPYLTFEGNIDGDRDAFFGKIATEPLLVDVYLQCEGFAGRDLAACLREHDRGAGTWYVAQRGRSAAEIEKDALLREGIEAFIDANPRLRALPPSALYDAIAEHVGVTPALQAAAEDPPEQPFLSSFGRALVVVAALGLVVAVIRVTLSPALLVLIGVVGLGLAALAYLRQLEKSDPEQPVSWLSQALAAADAREDRSLQNHMCSVTDIKPGAFRAMVLRLSLTVIGLAHRLWYNRGDLGGIPTIHFARWILLPENRELVFFSNFDGSWERYLGDFIEQASRGLNSVWSNTVDYPKTRFLVLDGASDEERFKSFARNSMWRTRAWYAAYRRLSVQNVLDNAALRAGLAHKPSGPALDAWLRLL